MAKRQPPKPPLLVYVMTAEDPNTGKVLERRELPVPSPDDKKAHAAADKAQSAFTARHKKADVTIATRRKEQP